MRTMKQILEAVRNEISIYRYSGLCIAASCSNLSSEEYHAFLKYLRKNAPFNWRTILNRIFFLNVAKGYMWKPHKKKPRLDWLNKHINKNK